MKIVKDAICNKLIEMSKEKEIEKIRVKDICQELGISKQTFYHYFKDKYDVIAWIFVKDMNQSHVDSERVYTIDELIKSLEKIWERREFYRRALLIHGQNSLYDYIQAYDVKFCKECLKQFSGIREITEEHMFAIIHYSYGCLGYVLEWIDGKHHLTPAELAVLEFEYMPSFLKTIFNSNRHPK